MPRTLPSKKETPDFSSWTPRELEQPENAANECHRHDAHMMRSGDATFEERMMYLSLLQEIAAAVSESARDFFEIGCVPRVANIVKGE